MDISNSSNQLETDLGHVDSYIDSMVLSINFTI